MKSDAREARNTAAPCRSSSLSPATGGRALAQPGVEYGILDQRLVQRRVEVAWANGVDLQAVAGPVGAHAPREVAHGALRRGVGGDARSRQFALHAADVDDLAAAARNHVPRHGACPRRTRCRGWCAMSSRQSASVNFSSGARRWMPALLTRMSIGPEAGLDGVHAGVHLRGVGDVEGAHVNARAGGANCASGFIQGGPVAPIEDHMGAGASQRSGDGVADAARGSGDERACARRGSKGFTRWILAMPKGFCYRDRRGTERMLAAVCHGKKDLRIDRLADRPLAGGRGARCRGVRWHLRLRPALLPSRRRGRLRRSRAARCSVTKSPAR